MMLDAYAVKVLNAPLKNVAEKLKERQLTPNHITLSGFGVGILSFVFIAVGWYFIGLIFLLTNRIMDGLDGALARITTQTDAGGFLDICLDFIFYSGIVVAFAISDSEQNAIPAIILIFSFVGTGKGTETILFFIAMALFPKHFPCLSVCRSLHDDHNHTIDRRLQNTGKRRGKEIPKSEVISSHQHLFLYFNI